MIERSRYHARCLAVWASLTVPTAVAQALALANLRSAATALEQGLLATRPFEDLLVWLCSAVALACAAWWWLTSTVVVVQAARGRIGARPRGYPKTLRRWLLIGCGVAVVGAGASTPAYADPMPDGERQHYPRAEFDPNSGARMIGREVIAGLPLPERIGTTPALHNKRSIPTITNPALTPAKPPTKPTTKPTMEFVTVQPGDSLWKVASRALSPDATTSAVDAAWRELYELNRSTIGSDPDLIHPGMRLRLPSQREK